MSLRTRTPRRAVAAGAALVLAASLAACSSDSDEGTTETAAEGGTGTSAQVSDTLPTTPLADILLTSEEAPGQGRVERIPPEALQQRVDQLVADQGRQLMEDPACDKVSRVESTSNHVASDAVMSAVSYKQSEENETVHRFALVLLGKKLDEYLDRSLYEACTTSKFAGNPQTELVMRVSDAPAVEGAEGFRVTSDFITTGEGGKKSINRTIIVRGYAHGTTSSVEYNAVSEDAAKDPILPEADRAVDALYTAQMNKLVKAE